MATIAEDPSRALELHQRGKLMDAATIFQRILTRDPTHANYIGRILETFDRRISRNE